MLLIKDSLECAVSPLYNRWPCWGVGNATGVFHPPLLWELFEIFGGVSRTIMCLENARVENAGRNCEFTSLVFSPAWADANTAPESVSME